MLPWGYYSQSSSSQAGDQAGDQGGSEGGWLRATQTQRLFSQTQTQDGGGGGGGGGAIPSTYSSQFGGGLGGDLPNMASGLGGRQHLPNMAGGQPVGGGMAATRAPVPLFSQGAAPVLGSGLPSGARGGSLPGMRFRRSRTTEPHNSSLARGSSQGGGGEGGGGGARERALAASRARARSASSVARAMKVVAYREYRVGELPDIQVPSLYLPCTFPVPSLYLPCTESASFRTFRFHHATC